MPTQQCAPQLIQIWQLTARDDQRAIFGVELLQIVGIIGALLQKLAVHVGICRLHLAILIRRCDQLAAGVVGSVRRQRQLQAISLPEFARGKCLSADQLCAGR